MIPDYEAYTDSLIQTFDAQNDYVTVFAYRDRIKYILQNLSEEFACEEDHCDDYAHEDMIEEAVGDAEEELRDKIKRDLVDFIREY